ncbi:MAG: cupin domain-containing protein [Bacteroidetes bacterium]|nr:cupin domain-containing protein [Bacteroidota bacterium]
MDLGRGKRLTVEEALTRIPTPEGKRFVTLYEHGMLQVEMYAPRGTDLQQPHTRDEAYIVADGFGSFFCDGQTTPFGPGDFLFVPAGVEHRFVDFSDDLAVWVLFYGPEGGEAGSSTDMA